MSISKSGRILIEVDPALKRELYAALAQDGINMKEWFVDEVDRFLSEKNKKNFIKKAK